jgi:hypothetical protein
VQGRLTFEDVAGGTDTLGQEISRTRTQGLQDGLWLEPVIQSFFPKIEDALPTYFTGAQHIFLCEFQMQNETEEQRGEIH